ncbi:MAG: hypothetical protein J6Q84_04425 [Kiritimatiellae bacterium]|nr:hypothetical protein [Kiritimatiellia bacterium]
MSAIRDFVRRVRTTGVKRSTKVKTVAMGRERVFEAWDIGHDTYIFEKLVTSHLSDHPSVLIVEKRVLKSRTKGRVFTMTTGNHSVAAFPLLDGRFWKLSNLPSQRRGETLMYSILCANVVKDTIEISQREVPAKILFAADEWLMDTVGFSMRDIVMGDRNDVTIEHYRQLGQEWRVKPLAWTINEINVALAASKKRISTKLTYYHSMKGVHFLTYPEFKKFTDLARTNCDEYLKGLKELVGVYEGNKTSFVRMPKHRGHHEIEFFGLRRGIALEKLVPEVEKLMEAIALGKIGQLGIIQRAEEILVLYSLLLNKPEYADERSKLFIETLYMYITGEIYSVVGEGSTPAFDDRRTALPGATFVDGRPVFHIGADDRSEVLLSNMRRMMSKDEIIEYANVYELRVEDEMAEIGKGRTREIVYKTNRSPLEQSMVEKLLSRAAKGYSSYMLSRIQAFKALGVGLSDYRVLHRRAQIKKRLVDVYVRRRCEGEPMDAIPENYFNNADDSTIEEKEVVLTLATLMGDAAAQNMAMKKYDPQTNSPLYGVGKEIYEFEYDIMLGRIVPKKVSICSIRGSLGWPSLNYDDENLSRLFNFYLAHFAHALKDYQRRHKVSMNEVAERFMDGFEYRTRAMVWQLSVMRDRFEAFKPDLPSVYGFDKKWHFAMWALDRQERRLSILRKMFFQKVEIVENESSWNNPE